MQDLQFFHADPHSQDGTLSILLLGESALERLTVSCSPTSCRFRRASKIRIKPRDDGIAVAMVVGDFASSASEDVMVLRRSKGEQGPDHNDFVLLGPDLTQRLLVPKSARGMSSHGVALAGGILRASGGPGWEGTLSFVRCR